MSAETTVNLIALMIFGTVCALALHWAGVI